jgi:sterol 3beta-glucosyltransferase
MSGLEVAITTVGTTGDVVPYVALTRALIARGHRVRAGSHPMHGPRFEAAGARFLATSAPLDLAPFNALMDGIARAPEPLEQFDLLALRLFLEDAEAQIARARELMDGAEVAICHRFDYCGQEGAIGRGVPWISGALIPDHWRSDEAPPVPLRSLGRWWARKTWNHLESMAAPINARLSRRLQLAGAPPRPLGLAGADSPLLNLVSASRHLVAMRGDWPRTVQVTGPWLLDEADEAPDPRLAEFLAEHPHPVVVTFGSMGGTRAEETGAIVSEALARVRHPTVVQAGYQGLGGAQTSQVCSVGYVPHGALFPQAACVVHHAGAGTSHAACRFGAPQVAVPHLFDQYYFGAMLARAGVAPSPIARGRLDARGLAERISAVLGDRRYAERARSLAARMAGEDGVGTAVAAIERVAREHPVRRG